MPKKISFTVLSLILSLSMGAWAAEPASPEAVQQAANQGDAKAQAKLGAMYLLGKGMEQDDAKAADWLLKSAKQGYIEAEVIVAALYDRGIGVKSDTKTATSWYEKAAAQGNAPSMAILGKNPVAAGGVAFSYQNMRLNAAKQIPTEYAKKILLTQ